jgi:hypothetical protein
MAHDIAREIMMMSSQIEKQETFSLKITVELLDSNQNGSFDTMQFDIFRSLTDSLKITVYGLNYQSTLPNINLEKRIKSVTHKINASPSQENVAKSICMQYFKHFLLDIMKDNIEDDVATVLSNSIINKDFELLHEKWEYFYAQPDIVNIPQRFIENMFENVWKYFQIAMSMTSVEIEEQDAHEDHNDEDGEYADF